MSPSRKSLESRSLHFSPEADRKRLSDLLSLAIHSESRLSPEVFEFPGTDGKMSFVEVTAAAFLDRTGKRGVMLILQEVTLRIQAEKQRTEAIVELRLIARVLHAFHAISTGSNENLSERSAHPASRLRAVRLADRDSFAN